TYKEARIDCPDTFNKPLRPPVFLGTISAGPPYQPVIVISAPQGPPIRRRYLYVINRSDLPKVLTLCEVQVVACP
ncbi:MAG: hypothetical protein ACRD7E_20515, partial [Bryobacteraceae bacterium]